MATVLKTGWSKPSTILFAAEVPVNEKAFSFALAQASEFGADLILFHVCDILVNALPETCGVCYFDSAGTARADRACLEPLAQQAHRTGIRCEIVVRSGMPADQILSFLREREIDRVVMGTHSPGRVGKLLVGSVAEAVLRNAPVPVCIIGPEVAEDSARNFATRTILCAASLHETSAAVAAFAAELASQHSANLILEHVIHPHGRIAAASIGRVEEIEIELLALIPADMKERISVQTIVAPGDPTEELVYQARAQQVDFMVLGAQGASAFAAITRHGVVYKVLAHSRCPVITLSPVVLEECGVSSPPARHYEDYLAGVF